MKKENSNIIIALVIVLAFLLVLAAAVGNKENDPNALSNDPSVILANAEKESKEISDEEKKAFNYINIDQYFELLGGDELSIILLARPGCQYCQIAEPIIQNVMYQYNLEVNYLNTDDFDEDALGRFINSDDMWSEGFGTPMLYLVQKNGIIDVVDGVTDRAHYKEFFINHGYVS